MFISSSFSLARFFLTVDVTLWIKMKHNLSLSLFRARYLLFVNRMQENHTILMCKKQTF